MKISLKELKNMIKNIIKESEEKKDYTFFKKDLRTPFTKETAEKAEWSEKEPENFVNNIIYRKDAEGNIEQKMPGKGFSAKPEWRKLSFKA